MKNKSAPSCLIGANAIPLGGKPEDMEVKKVKPEDPKEKDATLPKKEGELDKYKKKTVP